nr:MULTISPECIES: N-acetylmuramoyl-L-alanine amidase [unclassified Ciceribacter]
MVRKDGRAVPVVPSPYKSSFDGNQPKILVMHFTYGSSAASSAEWFRSKQNPGSSAHVVIDRDGSIIQCVSFEECAWHAGASSWRDRHGNRLEGLNRHSFGIELSNWGYLQKSASGWRSYTGAPIADPVLAQHKNGNPDETPGLIGWEPYPAEQIDAAVEVARAIVDAYGVDEIVGHDDIAPTRKWDPGPAFDMQKFRAQVLGDDRSSNDSDTLSVIVDEGLNLRSGPSTEFPTVSLLARGTLLQPLERRGRWLLVSVMKNGVPFSTGWVHGAYVA